MKLRTRVLGGTTLLVLLPLLALGFGIRREMSQRLTEQYARRVDALIDGVENELREIAGDLDRRLVALASGFHDDNRIRRCLVDGQEDLRPYVLDWTGRRMELVDLDLLQVQDAAGRIVSSGHFRNEYDLVDPAMVRGLRGRTGPVVVTARRPSGSFLALARLDSLQLGGDPYYVVAGTEIDRARLRRLAPGTDLVVSLQLQDTTVCPDAQLALRLGSGTLPPPGEMLARALDVPALARPGGTPGPARFLVTHSLAPRRELLRSLDRWLLVAWLLAAVGAVLLATRLSARISRPVEDLARKTRAIDLDRLDADFESDRTDEIGALSRFLGQMTTRLRASLTRVQEAERRATLGELARQVNHDLRNAFTPLRNVVRHLTQVAERDPQSLPAVYEERRETLESGLSYLEDLAGNWRRVSSRPERVSCDLAQVVRGVVSGRQRADGGPVELSLPPDPVPVRGDPTGLRRVVENLVANACESLDSDAGRVNVSVTRTTSDRGAPVVELDVRDDGRGIPAEQLDRVFDDFFTTKPLGSGLGLSVVRRLVSDFHGTVRVESVPGEGARFTVVLPADDARPGGNAP